MTNKATIILLMITAFAVILIFKSVQFKPDVRAISNQMSAAQLSNAMKKSTRSFKERKANTVNSFYTAIWTYKQCKDANEYGIPCNPADLGDGVAKIIAHDDDMEYYMLSGKDKRLGCANIRGVRDSNLVRAACRRYN